MPNLAWRHLCTVLVVFPHPKKPEHFVHADRDRETKVIEFISRIKTKLGKSFSTILKTKIS